MQVDPVSQVKPLKETSCISEDVCLLFDDMYLQKSEEYNGGKTTKNLKSLANWITHRTVQRLPNPQ